MQATGLTLWQKYKPLYRGYFISSRSHGMGSLSLFLAFCEGNPLVTAQRDSNAEFLDCPVQALVIWNVITFIWLHWNVLYFLVVLSRKSNAYKWDCFRYHQLNIARQCWHTLRRDYETQKSERKHQGYLWCEKISLPETCPQPNIWVMRHNGRHFVKNTFKCISLFENLCICFFKNH